MAKLVYKIGNVLEAKEIGTENIILAHIVNNLGVAGGGFVVPLAQKYTEWKKNYQDWCKAFKDTCSNSREEMMGRVGWDSQSENLQIANMVGQDGIGNDKFGRPPIRYDALVLAMQKVATEARCTHAKIIAPRFGSGLARGSWPLIEAMIKEFWVNQGIDVVIYVLTADELPDGVIPDDYGLQFTCPGCGGHRIESIEGNADFISVVKNIAENGEFDYEDPIITVSEVLAFQCSACGYRPGSDLSPIKDNLKLVEWIKTNNQIGKNNSQREENE